MDASARGIAHEGLVWALGSLAQLHRKPFDAGLVLQRFPPPYTLATLQQAAGALGFKAALKTAAPRELNRLPAPFFAVLREDAAGGAQGDTPARLALVIRCDGERVLYVVEDSPNPVVEQAAEFAARITGEVLLARDTTPLPSELAADEGFGFRWFARELLRHRRIWGEVLAASFILQLIALATPLGTQVVIDKVIAHQSTSTLTVIAVALGVFILFGALLSWSRQYLVLHTGNRVDAVLGAQVFEHLFHLPLRYFERRPTGTLTTRLQGIETIRDFLTGALVTLLLDLPFLLLFVAVMLYYSWQLTAFVLALALAIVAVSLAITPLMRRRINHQFMLGARNQAFLTEHVSGMETVKALQMEPQLAARYGNYLADYLESGFAARQLSNTYNVVAGSLEQVITLGVLCIGAWLAMTRTDFTIGMLVAFQMFAARLTGPLLRIVGLWQELQRADIAVRRLGDIMNATTEPYALSPSRETKAQGALAVEELAFRYAPDRPLLFEGFAARIEPGQCVAVMGPSGCGKSTLAKLLLGFLAPERGRILLDGRDIRHMSANELRRHFGVVPQDTVLFSGTLYDNLALANPHANFDQIVEVCRMAGIHDVIERLPEGYQTEIGEHGAGLSGGQKQRIAIARALLRRPRILVFDEAVSGLDGDTANQLAHTINRLRGKVTVLFITHQIPRALKFDFVLNLGDAQRRDTTTGPQATASAD